MWESFVIAFATYSKIPMPRVEWKEKSMRYSMCFFPLVGVVEGIISLLAFYLMSILDFGEFATAAVLTVLPLLINGGIHMDGFIDTIDARHSYKSREEKLEILKDPHTGAFAIIYAIIYMLLYFGFLTEITEDDIFFLVFTYGYVRIFSGLSVVLFQKAKKNGMVAQTADAAQKNVKWILMAELAAASIFLLFFQVLYGIAMIAAAVGCFIYYKSMSYKIFGGITGDLAGYFLQFTELMLLAVIVFIGKSGGAVL
jgi:adenosylcobinamide-GDP ribazoletransferase